MSDVQEARDLARANKELEAAREQVRAATAALVALESERAEELEALRDAERELEQLRLANSEAHATIQAMQQTRAWRLGAAYWRLRESLGRRL
jgi:hypothetical protein